MVLDGDGPPSRPAGLRYVVGVSIGVIWLTLVLAKLLPATRAETTTPIVVLVGAAEFIVGILLIIPVTHNIALRLSSVFASILFVANLIPAVDLKVIGSACGCLGAYKINAPSRQILAAAILAASLWSASQATDHRLETEKEVRGREE